MGARCSSGLVSRLSPSCVASKQENKHSALILPYPLCFPAHFPAALGFTPHCTMGCAAYSQSCRGRVKINWGSEFSNVSHIILAPCMVPKFLRVGSLMLGFFVFNPRKTRACAMSHRRSPFHVLWAIGSQRRGWDSSAQRASVGGMRVGSRKPGGWDTCCSWYSKPWDGPRTVQG